MLVGDSVTSRLRKATGPLGFPGMRLLWDFIALRGGVPLRFSAPCPLVPLPLSLLAHPSLPMTGFLGVSRQRDLVL